MGLMQFAQETKREIAKVTWPTRQETTMTTTMIVVMALVGGVFFFAVDTSLGFLVRKVLGMGS